MKIIILISAFTLAFVGALGASENEKSFLAPLVNDSLLLGASTGQFSIVVGERGHILVSKTPSDLTTASFSQVVAPVKVTLTDVYSIDNLAWAVGHDATILKSIDAGINWTLVQSDPELDRPLLSVYFFDKKEGVAVGAYGLFYRTLDGGDSWQIERHPSVLSDDDNDYLESIKNDEAFYLEELSFISPHLNKLTYSNDILYIAGEAGLIAVSEDRGQTWERLEIDYQGSFFDVNSVTAETTLAVGLRGHMFALNHHNVNLVPTCLTTSLNAVITGPSGTFVIGNNGVILKIDSEAITSSVLSASDNEGCQRHVSLSLVETEFSDAILTGMVTNNGLLLVTAGGLKTVKIEE